MPLWKRLYNMVWLATLSLMIFPRWFGTWSAPVHAALGIAVLALSFAHARTLASMPVPDRVKRIGKAVFSTAVVLAVVGVAFGALKHLFAAPAWASGFAGGLHVFLGLAVLAQSSSLATAYDMWEEKEIGPAPAPASPPAPTPPAS